MSKELIQLAVLQSIAAVKQLEQPSAIQFMDAVAREIAACFLRGGKVLVAGNGGSLCDAMHFAEELTGYFRAKRAALPAIALADPGHISCVGNDQGFEYIFSRGIEALGKSGDVFVGLSTSGNSPNIVNAFAAARELGLVTVAFLGKSGGKLAGTADYEIVIQGSTSDRIQEAHMTAIHIIIECIESRLFSGSELAPLAHTSQAS